MIHWMQKRKKYLVIIWIGAILGAGSIGWGTYSFSNHSSWVAKVGETKITQQEFEREYTRLYAIYNQLMGGKLNQKEAQSLGIQAQAIDNLIYTALMLNYAQDLGLYIADERVAQEIAQEEQFHSDGVFDEQKYRALLATNQLKSMDYEEAIRKSLLLKELDALLKIHTTPLEVESAAAALYMKDQIALSVMNAHQRSISVDDKEIKEYWEKNQSKYMGNMTYEIIIDSFNPKDIATNDSQLHDYYEKYKTNYTDSQKNILPFEKAKEKLAKDYRASESEKMALRRYIEYKKDLDNYEGKTMVLTFSELGEQFGADFAQEVVQLNAKDALKPIHVAQLGFTTLKLMHIHEAKPLDFDLAKERVFADVLQSKRDEQLKKDSEKMLDTFEGEDIGWVSKDDHQKLHMLSSAESAEFLSQLFVKLKPKGYMITNNKAILYAIKNQELFDIKELEKNKEFLENNVQQLKEKLFENAFIGYLQSRYKIVRLDQ